MAARCSLAGALLWLAASASQGLELWSVAPAPGPAAAALRLPSWGLRCLTDADCYANLFLGYFLVASFSVCIPPF